MGADIRTQLNTLLVEAREQIPRAQDAGVLERLELQYLGRKQGRLTAVLRQLGALSPEDRRSVGATANTVKAEIEQLLHAHRSELQRSRSANLGDTEWIDVTAPGTPQESGNVHPISQAIREITTVFERIGFIRVRHPEVDSDSYAFEALNMPPDHPARDEWETFFIATAIASKPSDRVGRIVLTPHTSNGQVREMEKGVLPIRMINIGKCYRRQIDATHTPMFHQFEGLLVDRDVTITNLKGTLDYFVASYFGHGRRTRLRPYHFQFTEPSFETDISCAACHGTGLRDGAKCKTCKSGWLELGGAGMVHPNVLKAGGIDPKTHSGFAFGWGVERVLMMKAGISDIRLLYGNDLRWLRQW